jgi:DNA-binding YbaB/EbfC family protein
MSGFNLQELMSQAKQQYETLQKKMEQTVVEASSGGGTVTVKMDGRKQVLAIKIDPEAVKAGDVEMLQSGDAVKRGWNARRTRHRGTVENVSFC